MQNWFLSRNLNILNYQVDTISEVLKSLDENEITVLAASPSAGKTLMTISLIDNSLIKKNENLKVVILTHGTTLLRTQFHNVLKKYYPSFSFIEVNTFTDYDPNINVNVCLPQTLNNKDLSEIDLLIVDEAHEFYLGDKMVKNIIKKLKPKKQLLLTGTPSKFIYENQISHSNKYNIIPVDLLTIYDEGMVANTFCEIASSSYKFNLYDYNNEHELKDDINISENDTNDTLDKLIHEIFKKLKSFKDDKYENVIPEWKSILGGLKKTMFACKNIKQAKQIYKYLTSRNINCALSTSDNDKDSLEIERFKTNDNCLVLLVVYRGVLGFSYKKLVNVVDMTTSHNINRIYQLFCRLARVDKENKTQNKLFFKVVPNELSDYYKHIMNAMFMFCSNEYLMKFNGKNFNELFVPVIKKFNSGNSNNSDKKYEKKYNPIDMGNLPVMDFFKEILHKKDTILESYAIVNIQDIRAEILNFTPFGYWTLERCKKEALKYKSRTEWQKNSISSYGKAKKYKWLDECCLHMIKKQKPHHKIYTPRNYWDLEKCKKEALKYNTRTEWLNKSSGSYGKALKCNWMNECCLHMRKKPCWDSESCKKEAKKYNSIGEWSKKSSGSYGKALKCNWMNECCLHMIKKQKHEIYPPRKYWDLESCKKEAKKYNSKIEWSKNSRSSFVKAAVNNWLDECYQYMEKNK